MDFKFIWETVWFFLPISAANQLPGLANKFNLPLNRPVSVRWLGESKTWAAYYTSAVSAMIMVTAQSWFTRVNQTIGLFDYRRDDVWLIGVLLGLGVVLGDHAKSFFKRRLGIKPGEPWRPFDQIDYVIGGAVAVIPLTGWIGWERFFTMVVIALLIHLPGNWLGKRLGIRKTVW